MTDTTAPTTPVGTTTPVVPSPNDLQINLEENTPKTEIQASTGEIPASPEVNLDLDLNLPEAPKNDDRLKVEDEKNETAKENTAPVVEPVAPVVEPVTPVIEPVVEPVAPVTPVVEPVTPAAEPVTPLTEQVTEIKASSEIIGENPLTSSENILPEKNSLENDMKMIEDLQGHASAGGLAPEAIKPIQAATTIDTQTPKTFDLDAMLGTTAPIPSPTIEQKPEAPQIAPDMTTTVQPVTPPAFTIPTPQTQVAVQAVPQIHSPIHKLKSVKPLLFVVLFAALGFTTFFILKTMYPLEFASMFGNNDTTNHASADITGTIEETTGTIQEITGDIIETTGNTMEDATFGELNDLETETQPEPTDLSRLTDYLNQGNSFREQGKTMNNNTVIKYGLYISKKATSLLEKIANGEEITNINGYFAQFDQYIAQLELLVNQSSVEPIAEQEPVSVTPPTTNETPVVNEPSTTQAQNNSFIAE